MFRGTLFSYGEIRYLYRSIKQKNGGTSTAAPCFHMGRYGTCIVVLNKRTAVQVPRLPVFTWGDTVFVTL